MPPFRTSESYEYGLGHDFSPGLVSLFVSFALLIAGILAVVCVGDFKTKCSNKLHTNWTGKSPDDIISFVHPTPRKEIRDLFDVRKSKHLKFCIECVENADRLLANLTDPEPENNPTMEDDVPGPSGIPASLPESMSMPTDVENPILPEELDLHYDNTFAKDCSSSSFVNEKLITTNAGKNTTNVTKFHQQPSAYYDKHFHTSPPSVIMPTPPEGWLSHPLKDGCLFLRIDQLNPNKDPNVVKTVTIKHYGAWTVRVMGVEVQLSNFPIVVNSKLAQDLIEQVESGNICVGYPDERYHGLQKTDGKVGKCAQFHSHNIIHEGRVFPSTIRSTKCNWLVEGCMRRCQECEDISNTLRAMYSKRKYQPEIDRISSSSSVRFGALKKEELLKRCESLSRAKKNLQTKVRRAQAKVERAVRENGEHLGSSTSNALNQIIDDNADKIDGLLKDHEPDSFGKLFWEQQKRAAKLRNQKGMRWHPMVIKWCLHLWFTSKKSFNIMKSSGVLKLPSDTTLRDYVHWTKPTSGLTISSLQQLKRGIKFDERQPHQLFCVLVHDEMKIRSDLVYQKSTGRLVGFTDLGNFSNQLRDIDDELKKDIRLESSIASHMFVLMVRGLFWNFTFPVAHFPTDSTTADEIFVLCWEAIEALEMAGLKVVAITSDGAATNRRFNDMHNTAVNGPAFETINPYAEDHCRQVFLLTDPPHLVKCVRNSWSHSFAHQRTRMLWNDGNISWKHLENLYLEDVKMDGLYLMKKLKYEHVNLTSFSRMKVSLAAQAISSSVANALELYQPSATATVEFVRVFDKFFDLLNVRSRREWFVKRKDNLRPYESPEDERLQWLEKTFIEYLDDWKRKVEAKTALSKTERNKMMITQETLTGLYRTARGFVAVARFLLKQEGMKFVLSERFNQDPLESCFGNQRQMRGGNEAPTSARFDELMNTQRLKSSQTIKVIGGNTKQESVSLPIDNTTLPKRRRSDNKKVAGPSSST